MFSWRSSKGLEEPSPYDEAVKELHKHIDEFHDIVRQETNKLRKEKELLTRLRRSSNMFNSQRC